MNTFEKLSIRLRHLPLLRKADWFWNAVRPCYDRVVHWSAPRGLRRVINGTDDIRLLPELRAVLNEYEPEVWRIVMDSLHPGARVVEAGGHIGLYAIAMAKRVGKTGKVIVAEPDPANLAILRQHVTLNDVEDQVQVIPAGLADAPGSAVLHLQGIQSQLRDAGQGGQSIEVSLTTIDLLVAGESLDLILVDVEGFELHVLRGAENLLRAPDRRPGTIVVEVHPYAWADNQTTAAALLDWLVQCGYMVTDLAGRRVTDITDYGHIVARTTVR